LRALVENVELLCLDAGNTIIFLDHPRIARFLVERGVDTTADALVRAEGVAKRGLEGNGDGELVRVAFSHQKEPGALGWGLVIGTTIALGGTPRDRLVPLLDELWADHVRKNLYSLVPPGLPASLERLRAAGVKTAVISNSEGMLKRLFDELEITSHFDTIVDSGLFGVEKPDPRIFQVALEMFSVPAERALHLGDTVATDVDGARAAGIRTALLDPYLHYDGLHTGIPRVESVEQVADAILRFKGPAS
jgi:HAD superfamily hydrolase (TIGR01509 family)